MAILLPPSGKGSGDKNDSDKDQSKVTNKSSSQDISEKNSPKIYPLVAIRDNVIFPGSETVLTFGRPHSVAAVQYAFAGDKNLVFITQRRSQIDEPTTEDLYSIGTLGVIDRTLPTDRDVNALIRGQNRVKILKIEKKNGFLQAHIEILSEVEQDSDKVQALTKHLIQEFKKAVNIGKSVEFLNFMKLMGGASPGELADLVAATLEITPSRKQNLLETLQVDSRLEKVIAHLAKEIKVLEIERSITTKTQKRFDKHIRDQVLRERLRTIQKELGDDEGDEIKELADLEQAIQKAGMPKKVKDRALKELRRLERLSINNPEGGYIRTWLETLTELPWNKRSTSKFSIKKSEQILNEDQYGLDEVKHRILEYLAVMKLKSKQKGASKQSRLPTILCFVGPPGVGKTSIGRSIAKALGREFVKVSLGGMRDESEIRGHRRTYVGAMPGRLIQNLRTIGSKNAVFMLDEIDKLGSDFRGDPSSALLEALDPEQNNEFSDHYLEVPFDLSEILFIATANVLDTIPPALRDRLEVIRYSGYTEQEKFEIAKRHLFSKVIEANGLQDKQLSISDNLLREIIQLYTREAGVRSLERMLHRVARKVARQVAANPDKKVKLTKAQLDEMLGAPKYLPVLAEKKNDIGIAAGLAWTSVGGVILFVEVALMPGKGVVQLTGQLGKVMQESARAAVTYLKTNAKALGIDPEEIAKTDIHLHVPEGAVPKDGPSAGITMTTAIVSAFTKRKIRRTVAMTGEVTLRGNVLEIGGLKEKVNAAHQAGITDVIIPFSNKKDLREITDEVKKDLTFHPVKNVSEVLEIALMRSTGLVDKKTPSMKKKLSK